MRNPTRARAVIAFASALAVVTCSFPDDQSASVYIVVSQSDSLTARGVLGDGETDVLSARAYQQVGTAPDSGNGDDLEITNVDFFWSSDNEGIATVRGSTQGAAEVTGVNPGVVAVRARPRQYEGATVGTTALRSLRAEERTRTRRQLEATAYRDRSSELREWIGRPLVGGIAPELVRRFGGEAGSAPLLDALLNLAPGYIQCVAAVSDIFLPVLSAGRASTAAGVGGRPGSCFMWREGGTLQRRVYGARAPAK